MKRQAEEALEGEPSKLAKIRDVLSDLLGALQSSDIDIQREASAELLKITGGRKRCFPSDPYVRQLPISERQRLSQDFLAHLLCARCRAQNKYVFPTRNICYLPRYVSEPVYQ